MYIDLIQKNDKEIVDRLKKLGFDNIFDIERSSITDVDDKLPFELKLYDGKDYNFIIQKGKSNAITDLDKNALFLNKGLCSKLKENRMFVIFKLSSLIGSTDFFRTYKNFLINGKLCDDYSVPALYVSFAGVKEQIKSPAQLVAFAEAFGYNLKNYNKSVELLLKIK